MAGRHVLVQQAQREHRVLRIVYQGAGRKGTKERYIEVYEFDGTYIDAFCRRAREKRTFRLDRVIGLELLDDRFVPNLHVMDAIDREGWANKSSHWRRTKAAEIDATTPAPLPPPVVSPSPHPVEVTPATYRPPDSSGFLAKVAAAIILGVVGLSALLTGGSSTSSRSSHGSSSYLSSPSPSSVGHSSASSSSSWEAPPARTQRAEHYGSSSFSSTLKDRDFRVESDRVKPFVAENGSYYGEANVNGVPKTVHVNGYYRSDGTYVRGHYRSAPYSNPPSFKSSTPKFGSTSKYHTPKLPTSSGSRGRSR